MFTQSANEGIRLEDIGQGDNADQVREEDSGADPTLDSGATSDGFEIREASSVRLGDTDKAEV
jgi:hypothetical protein